MILEQIKSDVDTFAAARQEELTREVSYDKRKWLYVPCVDRAYRYILATRGDNPLICIGINPSTAVPDRLDNTLKSVNRIALANGYDSFCMFNVYAQRATDPNDMDGVCDMALHRQNMEAFAYVLSCYGKGYRPAVWAAWGTLIEKRPYLVSCVRDMINIGKAYDAVWYRAGDLSKAGHPHHPLYLKKDQKTIVFDIESYLNSLT